MLAVSNGRVSTVSTAYGARRTSAPSGLRISSSVARNPSAPSLSTSALLWTVTAQSGPICSARAAAMRPPSHFMLMGPLLRRT